jgi:asparagine synthase (glutamine-hydrolysing)
MRTVSYSGFVADLGSLERLRGPAAPVPADEGHWRAVTADQELFLRAGGVHCHLVEVGPVAVLLRGLAVPSGAARPPDPDDVARAIGARYLEDGDLDVDGLEGSFTVALLDARRGRLLLYRNLVGGCFTYYAQSGGALLFGSNLPELVRSLPAAPPPNTAALPAYFLFRSVPGRETLFDGVYRLLPGEQVCFEAGKLRRRQRWTFADLREPEADGSDAADQVEAVLGRVLADYRAVRPRAANLLSGGVDSSLIQALWNQAGPPGEGPTASFSVTLDHERTRGDTDYALSAARAFGTRHTMVPADAPYAEYLRDLIGSTGEPPNHVQAAYFGHLARVMVRAGYNVGLCGEGADGLFGTCFATVIQEARLLGRLLPFGGLRRPAAAVAAGLGCGTLSAALRLAGRVDDLTDPGHPVNEIAVFADGPAVRACFGAEAVAGAFAARRRLLERLRAGDDPLEAVHAAGFLGEAIDSAALWTGLFNRAGGDLLCPFLDSRVLRLALSLPPGQRFPFRRPKGLLRRVLARHAPRQIASRTKRGFGQPVFEWLAPGGQLRPLVERIGRHDFLDRRVLARCLERPNWFLYSLLCYDLWHKQFVEASEPVPAPEEARTMPLAT